MQPFSKESEPEMKALKDEMQLVLKKEMEAQVSVYVELEMMHQNTAVFS